MRVCRVCLVRLIYGMSTPFRFWLPPHTPLRAKGPFGPPLSQGWPSHNQKGPYGPLTGPPGGRVHPLKSPGGAAPSPTRGRLNDPVGLWPTMGPLVGAGSFGGGDLWGCGPKGLFRVCVGGGVIGGAKEVALSQLVCVRDNAQLCDEVLDSDCWIVTWSSWVRS